MNCKMETKMIKRAAMKGFTLGAVALLILAAAGGARASVVFEEGFGTAVKGTQHGGKTVPVVGGTGWRAPGGDSETAKDFIEYDLAQFPLNPNAGTIEFDITRDEVMDPEAVFTFLGGQDEKLLTLRIYWNADLPVAGQPTIKFAGRMGKIWYVELPQEIYDPLMYPGVPMGKAVGKGQTVHIALTWGPTAGALFIDGKKLVAKRFDGPFPMAQVVSEAETFLIGAERDHRIPDGSWSAAHSIIDNFRIHDTVLSVSELGVPVSEGGEIVSVEHDAARVAGFSGKLVAGDTVAVSMEGTSGNEASFDVLPVADIRGEIPVSWKGWGVYLEDITFFDDDQVDLRDVEEYRVYVSRELAGEITLETEPVEILEVGQQSYMVDTVSVPADDGGNYSRDSLDPDTPYYVAVMALMDDDRLLPVIEPVQGLAMSEVEGAPGSYEGTYTVDYQDRYAEAVVVGRLGSGDAQAVVVSDETIEVDPALKIQVISSVDELKADEESTAEIKVTVTDANDDPVSDHEVRFVLATTSQYTGVVGGGNFTDEVGGSLSRDFWGETDLFGQVTATYTAGFAAKTAIIVARDMVSSDVGAGYVKTYIEANAELELEAVQQVAGKALGYTITVTSSDEWLTADGESEARITALVAQNGIPVEGHRVSFRVTSGAGKIRTIDGETGSDGKARAVYTAGKKIGIVLITAVDQTVGISGSVQIELRSDAPAKIAITLTPDLLPADGRSTADIEVVVTDINDNPNEGIEVEYEVEIGSGRLRNIDEVTDRRGESAAEYVAGRMPGKVSIKVTVRSTVPTDEEMAEARALATAVTDYDFF